MNQKQIEEEKKRERGREEENFRGRAEHVPKKRTARKNKSATVRAQKDELWFTPNSDLENKTFAIIGIFSKYLFLVMFSKCVCWLQKGVARPPILVL